MNEVLDKYLCEFYPRIFSERELSPRQSCMGRGIETGNGWFPLICSLCDHIQNRIDYHNKYLRYNTADAKPIPQVVFQQVKEKFGGLRIYHVGGDDYIQGLIDMTASMSYHFCEICSKAGYMEVGHTEGWIQSVCKDCAKESKRTIKFDKKMNALLKTAIQEDHKRIFDFYASR